VIRTMLILRRLTIYLPTLGQVVSICSRLAADGVRLRRHFWRRLAWLLVVGIALFWVQPLASADSLEDSTAQLRETLAGLMAHPVLHGARVGAAVVSIPDGDTVYSRYAEQLFVPASTIKLLVTASALRLLGPQFVYQTSVWSPVPPSQQGVVAGDLVIAGTADPTADTGQYRQIARELKARGISSVQGNIIGAGPLTASDGDEGLQAARGLHRALVGEGIPVAGSPAVGMAPPGVYLIYRQTSTSLGAYIRAINLYSDNHRAGQLLRSLRTSFGGDDTPYGFIGELWAEAGLDVSGLQLIDGSGMSHRNRVSPGLLTSLLVKMADDDCQLSVLLDSLPLAGVRGTLSGRMKDTVAEGCVYAKTGTLNRVSCLAGYIMVDEVPYLAFALMMDGYSCPVSKVRKIQDQVAIHLTRYALAHSSRPSPLHPAPPSLRAPGQQ